MSGIKISALPAIPSSAFADVAPFVQSGTTYKASNLQIATLFGFDSTSHLLAMSKGGTNANLTAVLGALPYSTASAFALTAALTNGQLLIGSTGLAPSVANLTAGMGITITNGAGSISIAASGGGLTWNEVVVMGPTAMAVSNGYIANNAGLVSLLLPAVSAVGDVISIVGKGAGGWRITQGAGQQIQIGSSASTLGAAGTVSSANQWDSVNLVCVTANTIWVATGAPQSAGLTIV